MDCIGAALCCPSECLDLMMAAGVQHGQNHQVRVGEQPLLCLLGVLTGSLGSPTEKTQMLAARQALQVFEADARQPGNFVRSEKLLA